MSSWSEIRARSTDPLSSTINSLILRQNQANAISDEITDADTIFPVRILQSKLSLDDKNLTVGYSKPLSQAFYLPFEPDGDHVKLWTRFDSGGVTVQDYSCFGNNIEIKYGGADYDAPQPHLLMTTEDDGVAKNKISSYLESSKKHYFRITDPEFSLQDGNTHFSFFFKIFPADLHNVDQYNKRAVLLDYIENDQVSHAVRVELDDDGYLYFFVRWDYIDYFVKSSAPIVVNSDLPDYYSEDYDSVDYFASTDEEDENIVGGESETALSYVFCTFNKDTKVCTILQPVSTVLEQMEVASSTDYSSRPQQSNNLSLWLPLSGGNVEDIVYDISGLGNHGSFSSNIAARKPSYTFVDVPNGRRHALEFGVRDYINIPKTTSLNTLTSFSLSMFVYLHSDYYAAGVISKILFSSSNDGGNGQFLLYTPAGTSRAIHIDIKNNAGTERFLESGGSPLPATTGTWTHIVVTYDGTNYKIYVDKGLVYTSATFSGDQFTNSGPMSIGSVFDNHGGHTNIAHVMFWKNHALSLAQVQNLYDSIKPILIDDFPVGTLTDVDLPIFPAGYDEPDEPPAPGTPQTLPFTATPYQPTPFVDWTDSAQVNATTVSNLTSVYNVSGGSAVTDPVVVVYDVDPGTGTSTTNPFSTVYNLPIPGSPSTGTLDDSEKAYGQYIQTTSSALYGKKITRITVTLKSASATGGTLNIGIIKANGSTIAFGTAVPLSGTGGLTSSYQSFTRTNTTNTYVMAVGDAVGVFWVGGTGGAINIHRGGSGVHFENSTYSAQNIHDGTEWGNPNEDYSMAGLIETGGDTASTSPFIQLSSNAGQSYEAVELIGTGSALIGITPTKAEFRVYRENVSATGTVSIRHIKADGTFYPTLYEVNVSSLPISDPGDFNFVWTDTTYANPLLVNERFGIVVVGATGAKVNVMTNSVTSGSPDDFDTTKTRLYTRTVTGFTWVAGGTTQDLSGKISKGGNDFTGYINLDGNRKRTGIKVDTATSSLVGKKITKVTTTLKKFGSPAAGAIYCRIRDSSGGLRVTLNQTDISSISTSDTSIDFLNTTHNITLALDDTISIEYELGDASNYVMVRVNKNQFETTNTILFESLSTTINTATAVTDRDLAAILYTGGVTDTNARPRAGLIVNTPNSSLYDRAITKMTIQLQRVGTFTPGDMLTVKVVRGSDKAVVSTLGEAELQEIPTTFAEYTFENTGNSYVMKTGDMILLENLFGDYDNYIMMSASATDTVDDVDTSLVDWNGNTYSVDIERDLYAYFWTGGYTIYPDPNIPTPPTPYHYSHDMFFGAKTTADSQGLIDSSDLEPDEETMFNLIAADFRLYQGMVISQEQALNLYINKYTISGLAFTEVNTVAHSVVGADP